MSYPKDLDEYTEDELRAEINRRAALRKAGCCDYCERPFNVNPPRKFPNRHYAELTLTGWITKPKETP